MVTMCYIEYGSQSKGCKSKIEQSQYYAMLYIYYIPSKVEARYYIYPTKMEARYYILIYYIPSKVEARYYISHQDGGPVLYTYTLYPTKGGGPVLYTYL